MAAAILNVLMLSLFTWSRDGGTTIIYYEQQQKENNEINDAFKMFRIRQTVRQKTRKKTLNIYTRIIIIKENWTRNASKKKYDLQVDDLKLSDGM